MCRVPWSKEQVLSNITLATVTELVGLVCQCVTGDHKIMYTHGTYSLAHSHPSLGLAARLTKKEVSSTAVFLTSLSTAREARYLEKKHKHTELRATIRRRGCCQCTARAATRPPTDFLPTLANSVLSQKVCKHVWNIRTCGVCVAPLKGYATVCAVG